MVSSKKIRYCLSVAMFISLFLLAGIVPAAMSANASFNIDKMSDMSDFDPNAVQQPTGDTIKIGYMAILSGPGASNGELFWPVINWVAHDINKRGGIVVDGKKKLIQIIKGDTQSKPAAAKQEAERLILEEKVHMFWGTSGSHIAKVLSDVAAKYKVPFMNCLALSDELMNEKNFNRYTFQTISNTTQWNMALAQYYADRPEKNFYILCQDYLYGHSMGTAFAKWLAVYKPDAKIVGEDYHELFLKDFAPFLTKIMAARPDVLYTADWSPDGNNLLRTARNMGFSQPIANIYITDTDTQKALGVEATKNLVVCYPFIIGDNPQTPAQKKLMTEWHKRWLTWKAPFNKLIYSWPDVTIGQTLADTYWMFDIIERAASTDAEKIISVWEGDEYEGLTGMHKMRAEDHQAIFPMFVGATGYPTKEVYPGAPYADGFSGINKVTTIPAEKCTPPIPEGLKDRLKNK